MCGRQGFGAALGPASRSGVVSGSEPSSAGRACRATSFRRAIQGGAHERNRTADLLLTMQMLYRLSYVGLVDWDFRVDSTERLDPL